MIPVFIIAGLALLFFIPMDNGPLGLIALNAITKGRKVTDSTSSDDKTINEDPFSLAGEAGLSIGIYTLARVISSEEGNSSKARQLAVAFVTFNNGGNGVNVYDYATGLDRYGRQGGKRPVTTFLDPYQGHVELAEHVFAGRVADPTRGATNFFAPKAQDKLHAKDPVNYKTAADVHATWVARGLEPVDVEGIDSDTLRFYRPA